MNKPGFQDQTVAAALGRSEPLTGLLQRMRESRARLDTVVPLLPSGLAEGMRAGPLDAFKTVTLPLMLPGILAGLVLSFAACLGEFGATITFAANIPGETRTLTLAIYTALQTPGGEALAARLVALSLGLAVAALALAEWSNRRLRAWLHTPC